MIRPMNKKKLIGYGLAILSVLSFAAVQTGVGVEVRNAICGDSITLPADNSVAADAGAE